MSMVRDTPVRDGISNSAVPILTVVEGMPSSFEGFSDIEVTLSGDVIYMEYEDSAGAYHMMEFQILRDHRGDAGEEAEDEIVLKPQRPGLVGPPHRKFFEENGPFKVER